MRTRGGTCVARLSIFFCACMAIPLFLADVNVNSLLKPTGYVSDLAHVLTAEDKERLENFCTDVEQQLGVQLAIVTIDTLGDRPIRDFAIELARKWGVGDRKGNQGVLLLVAIKDHTDDIETGRGIEPYLTDGFSGSTLRAMRPELQAGDYGAALLTAARTMADQIAQGKGIAFSGNVPQTEQRQEPETHERGGMPIGLLLLGGFVLLIWLLSRSGRRGGGGFGGGGGFWIGLLLGNLLGGGRSSGSSWGDGGGFGGSSGGGGGFGGFGGGDFGGGGASSNW